MTIVVPEDQSRRRIRRLVVGCSRRALLGACWGAVVLSGPAFAQVSIPQPGTPLRATILNALRPVVAKEIGGDIEFVVSTIRVLNGWAYVSVKPQRPGGAPIDWHATKFRKAWEQDMMSDLILALLQQQQSGEWRVIEYEIGPTDVSWVEWIKQHKLPHALFSDE